jgi:DNA-binding CsgD family transcriptional regulator
MNPTKIQETYFELLNSQSITAETVDYSVWEKHRHSIQKFTEFGNSLISVFDLFKKQHTIYSASDNFFLGYSPKEISDFGDHFMAMKTHPDDFFTLLSNSLSVLKLYFNFNEEEKMSHKLINEFRFLNASNKYVRVIEQHQALELDKNGNLWLAISTLDVSPNQDLEQGTKSQIFNFRNGNFMKLEQPEREIKVSLTPREIQILKMVKEGFLSKEISDKLSISVHTVNTHRQRLLEKLSVNNSIEAVRLSSKLGLS